MRKFLLGFTFSMLVAQSAAADEKLYGVWKLNSFLFEDAQTKEKKGLFGEHPKGFMILLPPDACRDHHSGWTQSTAK